MRRSFLAFMLVVVFILCYSYPGYSLTGILVVESDPPGAKVYLNGTYKGEAPYEDIVIPLGTYSLELSIEGYSKFEKTITINKTDPVLIRVTFKKAMGKFGGEFEEYKIETDKGNVVIASVPSGAEIYIDGEAIERPAPFSRKGVDVGTYKVRAKYRRNEIKGAFDVVKDETTKIIFDFNQGKMIDEQQEIRKEKERQARLAEELEKRQAREYEERLAREKEERIADEKKRKSVLERTEIHRMEQKEPDLKSRAEREKAERKLEEMEITRLERRRRKITSASTAKTSCFTDDCHESLRMKIREAESVHVPVAKNVCEICHISHDSGEEGYHPQLKNYFSEDYYVDFRVDNYKLCWDCHSKSKVQKERPSDDITAFRNGDRNLHMVHVNKKKGRSCKTCHDPHASVQLFGLRLDFPFGNDGWKLKIDFKKTPRGGSCVTGCHREFAYDRKTMVNN